MNRSSQRIAKTPCIILLLPRIGSLIYFLSLIVTPVKSDTQLKSNSRHGTNFSDVFVSSRAPDYWRRRSDWGELRPRTNHRDYVFPSIGDRPLKNKSLKTSTAEDDLMLAKNNPYSSAVESRTLYEPGRPTYIEPSSSSTGGHHKTRVRTLHGKRTPSPYISGNGKKYGISSDVRKRKEVPSINNKERVILLPWNSYLKSQNERLPTSRKKHNDFHGPRVLGSTGARGSGFDKSFLRFPNGRFSDSRIRPHQRHVLDRSYFLPSYEKPSKKEPPIREEAAKMQSSTNEFNVPPIHKIPKPSHLKKKRPNIVLILTDDLDVELGALNYMPHLLRLMGDGGALFSNSYTTTPMCCPSRSSMLTGMYIHNHQVFTNHQNCSSPLWQNTHERRSFASYLSNAGYRTGYFGKYLNRYNGSHVPPGWKEWAGLLMNSRYYNYTVNRNSHLVKYGNRYPHDYYPNVITNDGIRFLRAGKGDSDPFLLVLSYPSPHGPEDSAPEHAHKFFNASDHHTASYNYAPNPDKQWMLQFTDRMPDIQLKYTDLLMTKRLQTLQTVDGAIEKIVSSIAEIEETNNTYLFFTSDHGYHLGQFGLAKGKSMPFEFDIKVPFLARGPGIKPGIDLPQIALNIDLAPTFLDIAGLPRPPQMDGRSLLPVLQSSLAPDDAKNLPWRDSFLVESSGRLREEEELEKKEQRTWERERALTMTLLKATSSLGTDNGNNSLNHGHGEQPSVSLYTSKHERLEEVCQRVEFSSPCKRTQKWHCIKIGIRWKIKKCRHKSVAVWQKHCICHFLQGFGTYRKLDVKERRKQRNFLKKYVTKDFHAFDSKFIKSFNNINIPLHFGSRTPRQQPHKLNKRKRNGRHRYRRSVDLPDRNSTMEFPFDFEFENFTEHLQLEPFEKGVELQVDETDFNVTEDDADSATHTAQHFSLQETPGINKEKIGAKLPLPPDLGDNETKDFPSLTLHKALTDQLVHDFVEEEELRDIKDQIHEIADEIHSLESVSSTSIPIDAVNASSTPDSSKHGCQANDGHIDCQDEVYENLNAWKSSKVAIEDQIRRLRQQLHVMKNILRHLQAKKPDLYGIYGTEDYSGFEEDAEADEFYHDKMIDNDKDYDYEDPAVGIERTEEERQWKKNYESKNQGSEEAKKQKTVHHAISSSFPTDDVPLNKQLTLPEVGLEIPLVEDVNYSLRKSKKQKHQGRKHTQHHRKDYNDRNHYFDNDRDYNNRDYYFDNNRDYNDDNDDMNGKLYYPVSLPSSGDEVSENESLRHRFCWCDRRIIKKMAVQEARERKRQERQKMKEKRQQRRHRKKKKEKSLSCNYSTLNCYTHDNDHWKTPPLWTDGQFCFCINSANNTYWCLRTINETHNFLYCEFITGLITYYDLHIDPYQLRNVAFTLSNERVFELNEKLTNLRSCKGADECDGWVRKQNKRKVEKKTEQPSESPSVTKAVQNLKSDLHNSSHLDDLDHLKFKSSLKRKKMKKLQERQRRKRLRKEKKKYKETLKFDGYLGGLPEDPFVESGDLQQSVRIPRKSRHNKIEKKQRRKEKKRQKRKRKKEKKRLAKIRYNEKPSQF